MKWFKRKTQKQMRSNEILISADSPTAYVQSPNLNEAELQGFILLLLRPSLLEIFDSQQDNSVIDADGIVTSLAIYGAKGMNKNLLEMVPILSVSESGNVGYTYMLRLDLHLCLHKLANSSNPAIDYPLGLFENRDVMVVTNGLYMVTLMYQDPASSDEFIGDTANAFPAPRIIWASTIIDEGHMTNLRRLEVTIKTLLTPKPELPPKLPPEIAGDWLNDFLEPMFNHIQEKIRLQS